MLNQQFTGLEKMIRQWGKGNNSRLVENRSDSAAKEQLASLAFRSDSMLAVDLCSLAFWEGHVLN